MGREKLRNGFLKGMLHRLVKERRGQVLVLFALTLPVILGIGALAVDVGYLYTVRNSLQNAADAAALAGASGLSQGTVTAQGRAIQIGQANQVLQQPVSVQANDVEFGTYDSTTGAFVVSGTGINALRVTTRANAPLFFASLLGFNTANITTQAIAGMRTTTCGAIFARIQLTMSGEANTDSYNSNYGPYNAQAGGTNASVCSNGDITLSGQATVRGNATAGPNSQVNQSGQTTVTGTAGSAIAPFPVPAVNVGNAATVNDNGSIGITSANKNPLSSSNDFSISGQETITLNSGTYYFKSVSMSGGSAVNINANSGPVIIYVTDQLSVSGQGFLNQSSTPANLRIFVTGSSVNYSGNSDFYGVLLAPDAQVNISGAAHYYGTVTGDEVVVSGQGLGGFHYDEALSTTNLIASSPGQAFLGG